MTYVFTETPGADGAPLVFTFHGTGGDETQFHALARDLVPGAHVISPRGDVSENGALRFFRRTGEGVYDMQDLAARTRAMTGFIKAQGTRIGASRVIGLGYSNGANILAATAFAAPELFTDLVLMHPLIPWQPDPAPGLARVRTLITAGRRDPICPADLTEALARFFEDEGSETRLAWHEGGHEIRNPELSAALGFLGDVRGAQG